MLFNDFFYVYILMIRFLIMVAIVILLGLYLWFLNLKEGFDVVIDEQSVQKVQGPRGPSGPVGIQGARGFTGPVGAKGDKGDEGNTGPTGKVGKQGETGGDFFNAIRDVFKKDKTKKPLNNSLTDDQVMQEWEAKEVDPHIKTEVTTYLDAHFKSNPPKKRGKGDIRLEEIVKTEGIKTYIDNAIQKGITTISDKILTYESKIAANDTAIKANTTLIGKNKSGADSKYVKTTDLKKYVKTTDLGVYYTKTDINNQKKALYTAINANKSMAEKNRSDLPNAFIEHAPVGTIIAWYKNDNGPDGGKTWKVCNGGGVTPDLKDKFILGTAAHVASNNTGGGPWNEYISQPDITLKDTDLPKSIKTMCDSTVKLINRHTETRKYLKSHTHPDIWTGIGQVNDINKPKGWWTDNSHYEASQGGAPASYHKFGLSRPPQAMIFTDTTGGGKDLQKTCTKFGTDKPTTIPNKKVPYYKLRYFMKVTK